MGSICSVNLHPKSWPITGSVKFLKPEYGSERIIEVTYGWLDDYPNALPLNIYIRESIYKGLIANKLSIRVNSHGDFFEVVDENGVAIPPLRDTYIY